MGSGEVRYTAPMTERGDRRIVLVTGGSGFIGGHLVDRLVDTGHDVRILDVRPPRAAPNTTWIDGDVRDRDTMVAAAESAAVVYHLGAIVGVERMLHDPLAVVDVTVNGTLNAVEAAASTGAALVHVSSSEVLGRNVDLPWSEDADRVLGSALVDRWTYASAKAAAEHAVIAGAPRRGVPATVIRPFNVYGPRQGPGFVIPSMIRSGLRGEPLRVDPPGTQTRCFTYVGDVIDALAAVGANAGQEPVLHIGSSDEITMRELADRVERALGAAAERFAPDRLTADDPRFEDIARRRPDTSLAYKTLAWEAETPLDDGLATTVAWARRHPE